MKPLHSEASIILDQFISKKKNNIIKSIKKIPGDASSRVYFRIKAKKQNYIMLTTSPFSTHDEKVPFLLVQKYLKTINISVPKIFGTSPAYGLILLEDLGDFTLLDRLQQITSLNQQKVLYKKAIDLLISLQTRAIPKKDEHRLFFFNLKFDSEKLMTEVEFAISHFFSILLKRKFQKNHLSILTNGFKNICSFLAEKKMVFTHRDFHSRNIMVNKKFFLIDFQDARMGIPQYDLVSLLRDSYYHLEESDVLFLLKYYIKRHEEITSSKIDYDDFLITFDYMTIQRSFKAIGSFSSFMNQRGNLSYLRFIGNSFENIKKSFLRYPEFKELRRIFFRYYFNS